MQNSLIIGDLGNSTVELGEFLPDSLSGDPNCPIPRPLRVFRSRWEAFDDQQLQEWLDHRSADYYWKLGSVNREGLQRLVDCITARGESWQEISLHQFEMPVLVRYPERLGIDRLAAAVAADRLRAAHHAAIVIDSGTAITVDCVSAQGAFLGGTISPGLQLSLRSLHAHTDQLPSTCIDRVPPLIGDETSQAMRAGVYWMTTQGLIGLVQQLRNELGGPCQVVATGGGLPVLMPLLADGVQYVPHLVLSGLALAK